MHPIGTVAAAAHITVRALHHYDDIGLLRPSGRTPGGYRCYADADLDRLQRILAYRELGFSLDEIAAILDDADLDPVDHLRRQRAVLVDRIDRLEQMLAALDKAMEARMTGINLTPEEVFEMFGEQPLVEWAEEAEQRWADTDAYRESRRRSASYSKADWQRVKAEGDEVNARFVALLQAGEPATSPATLEVAEAHRGHLERWFYPVPYQMHRGLATMYLADPRFTATYETQAEGLAQYVHDAIIGNAERH